MGIFSKWKKKKTDEQLAAASEVKSAPKTTAKAAKVVKKDGKATVDQKAVSEKSAKTAPAPAVPQTGGTLANVLVRTHITEKAAGHEGEGVYTFEVSPRANKYMIAQAVQNRFHVEVAKVTIMNRRGKRVRFGTRRGKRKDRKLARVTLVKGQTLSVHKGV